MKVNDHKPTRFAHRLTKHLQNSVYIVQCDIENKLGKETEMDMKEVLNRASVVAYKVAIYILLATTLTSISYVLLASIGVLSWISIPVIYQGVQYDAGIAVAVAVMCTFIALSSVLPMASRILALQVKHRDFRINMEDVKEAYKEVLCVDMQGKFSLPGEFDSTQERMEHLLQHDMLGNKENDVLMLAAQMSSVSKKLSKEFSDEKTQRAVEVLEHRKQDIQETDKLLEKAEEVYQSLRVEHQKVAYLEQAQQEVAAQLIDELRALQPKKETMTVSSNVTQLPAE